MTKNIECPGDVNGCGGKHRPTPSGARDNPAGHYGHVVLTCGQDNTTTANRGSKKLKGYRALITGGNTGIGRAVALAYAREGADVAIHYLPADEKEAQEVVTLIRAEGQRAVAIPGDIRQESFCELLVHSAANKLGGLDILVNNACRQQFNNSIRTLDTKDFDATFKTNVYAMFWVTKAALNYLPEGSAIINTSSAQAFKPSNILLDYAQTKAAIIAFTKSLAQQLCRERIKVNAITAAPSQTGLPPDKDDHALKSVTRPHISEATMSRREPSEIESLYIRLASRDGRHVTGQVWFADD